MIERYRADYLERRDNVQSKTEMHKLPIDFDVTNAR
jgi:hypothetical protein